jgi:CheY-like chemotaxis protein
MLCILYVDDDLEDIEIFQEAVKAVDPSIQYISATSAKEALEILNSRDALPNYIVLDINMPGMDGKLCLKEIRKEERFNAINVIVYSTNSFPKDIEQIESLGATFIRKANSFNELCDMVSQLTKGRIGKS